jgi:hypothetical protein
MRSHSLRSSSRTTLATSLALLTSLAGAGCRQILGASGYEFVETPSDAGDDGALADASDAATCKLATVPARNVTTEVGGTQELVFVVKAIDLGEGKESDGTPTYLKLGLDQDGSCRTEGGPRSCTNPAPAASILADGIEGRDDGLGRMIADVKDHFGQEVVKSSIVNEDVAQGRVAPQALFRIRGYDGLQDDNHVDVDWFLPLPLPARGGADADSGADADAAMQSGVPAWDESDHWPVLPDTFVPVDSDSGAALRRTSIDGYVSNYRLVARFPENIPFRFWYFVAPLRSPTLTAEIFPDTVSHQFRLENGMIAGVALMSDFLAQIPIMSIQLPLGMPLCRDNPLYGTIHDWMCSFSDAKTQGSAGDICDAISMGYAFDASRATLGPTVQPPAPAALCAPGNDPAHDRCFVGDAN